MSGGNASAFPSMQSVNPMQVSGMPGQDVFSMMTSMMSTISMCMGQLMGMISMLLQSKGTSTPGVSSTSGSPFGNTLQNLVEASKQRKSTQNTSSENNSSDSGQTSNVSTGGELYPDQSAQSDSGLRGGGCGLIAAMAFLKKAGKSTSLQEVKKLAQQKGYWDGGMGGPEAEYKLLKDLGLNASKEDGVNWDKVTQTVQGGKPVIFSTAQHYWVAEGYDPKTKKYNFGNSAKAVGLKGDAQWMTKEEYLKFVKGYKAGGSPTTTYYLND